MSGFGSSFRDVCAELILVALLAVTGCATPRNLQPVLPYPPSEKLRAEWKTIAVSGGLGTPEEIFQNTSGKGSGALAGAGSSVCYTIGALSIGDGYGVAVGIMISPVAALVGAVVGAVKAEPAQKVREHRAALDRAYASINWQTLMCDPVIETARQRTRLNFVAATDTAGESQKLTNATVQAMLEVQVTPRFLNEFLGLSGSAGI
jgi:hypothetical protein